MRRGLRFSRPTQLSCPLRLSRPVTRVKFFIYTMGVCWFFIVIFRPSRRNTPRAVDLANLVEPRARTFVQLLAGNSIVEATSVAHYRQVESLPLVFSRSRLGDLCCCGVLSRLRPVFLFRPHTEFFLTAARVVVFVSPVSLHPRIIFIIILGLDSLCD